MHRVTTAPSLVPTTPTANRPRPQAGASDRYSLPWACHVWSMNSPPRLFPALLYSCGCSQLTPGAPPARDSRWAAPPPLPVFLGTFLVPCPPYMNPPCHLGAPPSIHTGVPGRFGLPRSPSSCTFHSPAPWYYRLRGTLSSARRTACTSFTGGSLNGASRGHSSWADVDKGRGHRARWRSRALSDLVCAYPQRGGHP